MITVVGLGFVGLTTALGFADKGYEVLGVEKNLEKYKTIKRGEVPFFEEGLFEVLSRKLGNGFSVSNDCSLASESDFYFLCVGTPCGENGEADLSYIFDALDAIVIAINNRQSKVKPIIIIKSTVPPSSTFGKIKAHLEESGLSLGEDCFLANNPEFLREGHAWSDFTKPDRVVIGVESEYAASRLCWLYEPFNAPVHVVSGNTAEFIKYASNATLATLISFSNELAELAETIGEISISEAFRILQEDERWHNGNMRTYLYPGCGYGGYCLPKDTVALSNMAKTRKTKTSILDAVIDRNATMAASIASRISTHVSSDKTIGILGLSFKPESDDVRESPSAKIIMELVKRGYRHFAAYDPIAVEMFKKTYLIDADIIFASDVDELLKKSDIAVILTAWDEFKSLKDRKNVIPILDYRYIL